MATEERTAIMSIRLKPSEEAIRNALAEHLGTDSASVMRQAILKLAREEGIIDTIPLKFEADESPKAPKKRVRQR